MRPFCRPESLQLVMDVSPSRTFPKSQPNTPSVRYTRYFTAPGTEAQERRAPLSSARPVTTGASLGALGQPAVTAGGVGHAIPWRLNAAKRAPMCGVPSRRLPLSSSAARKFMYAEVAGQPPEPCAHVKTVPTGPAPR